MPADSVVKAATRPHGKSIFCSVQSSRYHRKGPGKQRRRAEYHGRGGASEGAHFRAHMPIRSAKQDLRKWLPAVHSIIETRPAIGECRRILNIDNPDVGFIDRSEVAHGANPLVEVPNELAVAAVHVEAAD